MYNVYPILRKLYVLVTLHTFSFVHYLIWGRMEQIRDTTILGFTIYVPIAPLIVIFF